MFKKTTLALLTASLFISTSALAISNNTITFRGEVSDETCSVAINGNQAKPVVILPTVSAKELAKGGDVAGQVTFDIGLTGAIKGLNEEQGNVVSRFGLKLVYGSTLVSVLSASIAALVL